MRKLLYLLVLCALPVICVAHSDENWQENDMLKNMQQGDKAAVLMVHFGTSYDDTSSSLKILGLGHRSSLLCGTIWML